MAIEGYVKQADGSLACDTDTCKAVCCRSGNFRPDRKPPCEYLEADNKCELHKVGGHNCKPKGCWDYPRSQADIDSVNAGAEAQGFTERCLLRFVD